MAVSAASLLTRLDELKKWQEQQQKRLLLQNKRRFDSTDSDYNTIQGLSSFDLSQDKSAAMENCTNFAGATPKHILQQEVQAYKSLPVIKSKKPFLRRGTGLGRFGMNPGDQKRPFNRPMFRRTNHKDICGRDENEISNKEKSDECNADDNVVALYKPECNIKARWCAVDQNSQEPFDTLTKNENENKQRENEDLIAQINKFAWEKLGVKETISESSNLSDVKSGVIVTEALVQKDSQDDFMCIPSEQSLYDKAEDKELLIFESLEQRVMHSSFSSTNSSVIRLLSSTPNKKSNKEILESENVDAVTNIKKSVHFESNDKDKLIKLLHSLQARNEFINIQNTLNSYPEEAEHMSSQSSINSEDLDEETVTNIDFKDTECWTDINTNNSGNSSFIESMPSTVSIESSATTCALKTTDKGTNFPEETDEKVNDSLPSKLQELEVDLKNCKIERRKLEKVKAEIEKEQREFRKEKKAFEKYVLDEKIKVEFYLEDEKKKLAKEKMIFERYVKDVNNRTTRKEREEISTLKSELLNIKEAAKLKETRNATSQARLRNQIKTLEKENANLKEEMEKLLKQNAKLQAAQKFNNRKVTETKMLHEINKNLSKLAKDVKVTEQLNKLVINNDNRSKNDNDINKKQINPQEELLDDNHCKERRKDKSLSPVSDDSLCNYSKSCSRVSHSYGDYMQEVSASKRDYEEEIKLSSSEYKENDYNSINHDDNLKSLTDSSLVRNYEKMFGSGDAQQITTQNDSKSRSEVILSDGSIEVSYSNGNKKVVSPDGNFIVMKYFNGDIKETQLLEGVIRYYYAENQSWHTNYADGSELLEFSNGQTEKKSKDGTSEITFPNGIVKRIATDGSEKIFYPDGSKVSIDSHGQKILLLPNGQKEIHNEDHMRREYPDGTVKILYPDGIQETRYGNGRIRIKDKTGKLLLDSFDENT